MVAIGGNAALSPNAGFVRLKVRPLACLLWAHLPVLLDEFGGRRRKLLGLKATADGFAGGLVLELA
jgi:hypothetical protein